MDQAHWRGIVWPVGTYSYVTDEGRHATIPAYTTSADRPTTCSRKPAPSARAERASDSSESILSEAEGPLEVRFASISAAQANACRLSRRFHPPKRLLKK